MKQENFKILFNYKLFYIILYFIYFLTNYKKIGISKIWNDGVELPAPMQGRACITQ